MYGNGYERFVPGIASADAEAVNELIQATSAPPMATGFPFADEAIPSRQALLDHLPPFRQRDQLKDIFFEVYSPLFHILHDPTFHMEYANFCRCPGEVSLSFLALVFVILSISVNALDSDHPLLTDLGHAADPSANIKSLATKYRSAAMRCLSADQFLWRHNLHTVQALVLLIYAISHAHGPSWALLGTTFHICVSLGCHIDPSQLNLDPVRSEQRRRCWAGLMLLYTIQNTTLGNLAPMKLNESASVRLPADIDDEDISLGGILQRYAEGTDTRPPTKMSYILLKFKLYSLASDICQFARDGRDISSLHELERRITAEENLHEARFADGQQLPIYHIAHQYILNNYIHYLRLILHRPYLHAFGSVPGRGVTQPPEQVLQSRAHCTTAAMVLLSHHEDLCCDVRFKPYRWFVYSLGSFQAFLAASTLRVLLASDDSLTDAHRAQFLGAIQKCQLRFEDMAGRSDVCLKAARILRRLLQHLPTRPPPLIHQTSSASDESEMCSIKDGYTSINHPTPMTGFPQPGLPYDGPAVKADSSWFNCPPQMYELMSLPAEQWLGGASALAWDWSGWVEVDPYMNVPETLGVGPGVMM
ncbi:hypothetical protein G647_00788 [Cladophialophora carrionii CBS 160.54]|uniref:Xylanolytic transcriptional activator regulatory domain-containing protein n=1 Tax=Cladophialophora carrionii CBS 160.54 TaxID=1279043 RepID=V9DN57_9EURO|nr:uncharacterized protein G647_00788 [Cladophialophora carrionii CBS 160.54]ETI28339.1 hypothetical protein G647_00788 [Cladophialophora carrionii CBS 160.54]